ncbi:MAG: glycosyltransferase [Aureispira sp.]|nr:glycosyltransferase [Aureispira sp.]
MAKKSKQNKRAKKQGTKETAPTKHKKVKKKVSPPIVSNYEGKLSLVIPLYNESERVHHLNNALKKFDAVWKIPYEVILVNDGSTDDTLQLINDSYAETESEKSSYQIISLEQNQGKGAALKAGVGAATGDHILTLDADMAAQPTELVKWIKELPNNTFPEDTILIASREHEHSAVKTDKKRRRLGLFFNYWVQLLTGLNHKDTQCGFKLYPKAIAKALFERMSIKGWTHDVQLLYNADLLDVTIQDMPVKWGAVENSKINIWGDGIKAGFAVLGIYFSTLFKHFFVHPIKNKKLELAGQETGWYRFAFAATILVLLGLMPLLSFDYGITGDEKVQRVYGQYVLSYFESGGDDDRALTYKNLYFYGGLFDYLAAWIHKYILVGWDVYEARHFFNAIIGVLMMMFVGLTARAVSRSWLVALLSLLFIVLSPRIFGHSMNNPKDIPFAAGFLLTIYGMVNFLRQLPKPSLKYIMILILGIAISINIRVGGILLIAYLGLFTGIKLLFTKELRKVGIYVKIAIIGALIAFLGYLGGMLYWPYGRLAPFENPFTSLREMTNFSISVRILFGGDNIWSDQVPASYIPTWFMITTPLMVLLGVLLSVGYVIRKRAEANLLAIGLVVFVCVFPPAYAIAKKSSLYDGMRHMIFAYTSLPILAAIGWKWVMDMAQKSKGALIGVVVALTILSFLPLRSIFANHPYQYVYFNELVGGAKGAYSNYETDYWMTSMKNLCLYFEENELNLQDTVTIATNCMDPVEHFFHYERKEYKPNIKIKYVRYNEREKHDWDYGMFYYRFIDDKFIKNGAWPSDNVIKSEDVDGVSIGYLSKRPNKNGYNAQIAATKKNYPEGIRLLEELVQANPKNESALLMLVQFCAQSGQWDKMKTYGDQLLALSDEYSNALGLMGVYYLNTQNTPKAKEFLEKAVFYNYKYTFGHYHLARIAASEQDYVKAMNHLELFDANGGKPADGYNLAIKIAQTTKDNVRLYYFQAKVLGSQGKANESYQMLANSLAIDPTYAPAVKFKKQYDDQIEKQRKDALRKKQQELKKK